LATFSPEEQAARGSPLPISQTQGSTVLVPNGLMIPIPLARNIHLPKGAGFLAALTWDAALPPGTSFVGWLHGASWTSGSLSRADKIGLMLKDVGY
jgi:hypothetical protein